MTDYRYNVCYWLAGEGRTSVVLAPTADAAIERFAADNPSAEVYGAKHQPTVIEVGTFGGKPYFDALAQSVAAAINKNIADGADALFYVYVRTARTVYGSVFKRASRDEIVAAWNCSEQVIPMADVVSVTFERRN